MVIFLSPYAKCGCAMVLIIYFAANYFLFSPNGNSRFYRDYLEKTLAMYIYAFPCQELFKCEALLAMPENAYYQKVSSYRLLNGKDMIICRDQIYFMILAFKKLKSAT